MVCLCFYLQRRLLSRAFMRMPFFSGGSDQLLYPWFVSAIKRRFFYKKTISLRCALPLSVCILRVLCWCTTVFFKNILKEIYGESTKKGLLAPTAICRSFHVLSVIFCMWVFLFFALWVLFGLCVCSFGLWTVKENVMYFMISPRVFFNSGDGVNPMYPFQRRELINLVLFD